MDLGPDFRLFCLALRGPQSAANMREMRALAANVRDWSAIVRGARRHRVAPAVLAGFVACASPQVPADVIARLRQLSVGATRQSLAQVAETSRLAKLFAEAGVRVLVLKGAALSAQLYGEPGRRTARDIDLLVDPGQLVEAQAVLTRAGYERHQNLRSPRQHQAYQRAIKEIEFFHATTGGLVELHYRLTDNPNLLSVDFTSLWHEREEVRMGGCHVATLARQRLPLYLCVHGADHGWARLHWLMDFTAALPPSPGLGALFETAAGSGLKWPFLHALSLAHDWLGAPIESRLLAPYRDCGQMKRRQWLLGRLYSAADWHETAPQGTWKRVLRQSLWERLYRFSLKSDWRYRLTQLQREWFSPADRDVVPLPKSLAFLYPLVRPWGWLMRRLSLP